MKTLSRILGMAFTLAFCLVTGEVLAASLTLTYTPTSGSPITVSATIPAAAEPVVQAALLKDPTCGFVSTTITVPDTPAVLDKDGVTVLTPTITGGTAVQRNPATFAQAFQCVAGGRLQAIIDQINAGVLAAAQAQAAAAAAKSLIVVTPTTGQ